MVAMAMSTTASIDLPLATRRSEEDRDPIRFMNASELVRRPLRYQRDSLIQRKYG
jgi:hypothetical protein